MSAGKGQHSATVAAAATNTDADASQPKRDLRRVQLRGVFNNLPE
jgi:hypothetical protein